jgi:hypothetical protein
MEPEAIGNRGLKTPFLVVVVVMVVQKLAHFDIVAKNIQGLKKVFRISSESQLLTSQAVCR